MPALDSLHSMGKDEHEQYERDLDLAITMAMLLPLVRVTICLNSPPRAKQEERDVFQDGKFLREHKSPGSARKEALFNIPGCVYFHAGRALSAYGKAAFVFKNLTVDVEATPFGLGGLDCSGDPQMHADGGCMSPIAHQSLDKRLEFLRDSTWKNDWREKAGQFLAYYFQAELQRYFRELPDCIPIKEDPEGIYHDPSNKDWRSWTIEVRAQDDIDILAAIERNQLLWWFVLPHLEEDLENVVISSGIPMQELFPLMARLPASLKIRTRAGHELFNQLAENIRSRVLA
jgi:hypothetical protein